MTRFTELMMDFVNHPSEQTAFGFYLDYNRGYFCPPDVYAHCNGCSWKEDCPVIKAERCVVTWSILAFKSDYDPSLLGQFHLIVTELLAQYTADPPHNIAF